MVVSSAGLEDYDIIHGLSLKTWWATYGTILSHEQLDYMFGMMYSRDAVTEQMAIKGHKFLLVKDDKEYTGFASFELNYLSGTAKLHKLYVLPRQQGRGAGRLLLGAVERAALKNGNSRLVLNVNRFNPAVNFYLKQGYSKAGEEDIDIGSGYLMEDFIMVKEL